MPLKLTRCKVCNFQQRLDTQAYELGFYYDLHRDHKNEGNKE